MKVLGGKFHLHSWIASRRILRNAIKKGRQTWLSPIALTRNLGAIPKKSNVAVAFEVADVEEQAASSTIHLWVILGDAYPIPCLCV
jgi:hypothetical protein